jgi:hypothetical protein
MDYSQVFTDPGLETEFLDKFDDLVSAAPPTVGGGLEAGPGPTLTRDDAVSRVEEMKEGVDSGPPGALEAIIERFTRPVYLVQDSTFQEPGDAFDNSENITEKLEDARQTLESAIPSVGRVDVRNHRLDWVGTGWVVGPGIVATNRHVAEEFARAADDGFAYRVNGLGNMMRATLDWRHEHMRADESRFRVNEVLWIEPDGSFDVALLRIAETGEDDEPQPPAIELAGESDVAIGRWVGLVGYPARDSRNSLEDQQRIFDGIYNVKRLAPGQVTAVGGNGLLEHDATTLGGNSGSAVVDFETGSALALHFGGLEGKENYAVQAPMIADIVSRHAGV